MDVRLIIISWLLMLAVPSQHVALGLNLSSYETASFSINPSSEFTHFVTHNETGIVYVGASDALYQLGEDLVRQERVDTTVQCEGNIQDCPNYNKILLIDYTRDRLITCGSEKQGSCQTHDLSNINNILYVGSISVAASGKLPTEAIIAPGPDGTDLMYVSASYDEDRNPPFPLLSRRSLQNDDLFSTGRAGQVLLSESALTDFVFMLDYVSVFNWNSFTYSVSSQTLGSLSDFGDRERYVTKVSRTCHDAVEFDRSYAEILLECRSADTSYNLIQAAYVGPAGTVLAASLGLNATDKVVYGVFAKNEGEPLSSPIPSSHSALCVFKLQDIEEAFIDVIHGCLAQGDKYQIQYIPDSSCGTFSTTREFAILRQCEGNNWRIASGTELLSTAAIEWTDTIPSSIITTTHRDHTVAFVGTKDGSLVKIHIVSATSAREYERISLGGGPVLRDAEVDGIKEMVTVLLQQRLVKLRVSNCGAYTTCDECIGSNEGQDGDPYCGWCALKRRCTRYNECPMADVSTKWLPYNSAQCVSISNVTPNDRYPITITQQQITLTIEQLPNLVSGASYQCVFDDIPAVPAIKDGNILICTTPASSDIPRIPMGSDHVTMQLFVYSTETQVKFVQRDFYFYECDTHKRCVSCTDSSWPCIWCIYSYKCTNDNGACSMEDDVSSIINGRENPEGATRQGPEECPQLVAQEGEILIPVGVSRSITVTGMNLPDDDRAEDYKCIVDIEGDETMTEADRDGNVFTCSDMMYNYAGEEQELDVSLSVVWTNGNEQRKLDDIYGFIVTMYKCSVYRPDCSRCLSNTTARPKLNCGWCSQDDACTVQGGLCSGGWMSAIGSQNCGAPDIINVIPPSGTVKGNTVIIITGTDLGRQFSDIESITVGDKDCDTDGLDGNYEVGSSVSCRTMSGTNNAVEPITVTVSGQQSTGDVVFTYRNPSISSIDPQEGPEAGGTIVTFTGQYLDACSEISATIGSECIMNRRTDVLNSTTARCRTTSSAVGSSHRLNVAFDGVLLKQSEDEFTYRSNPEVNDVQPRKTIQSGGITLTVTGNGFNLAQTPQVVMYVSDEEFTEDCENHNGTMMLCKTPNTKTTSNSISRRRRQAGTPGEASFGFIIGDVSDLLTWSEDNNVIMENFPDPVYFPFEENPRKNSGGGIEQIEGRNLDAGSSERDVTVYIGREKAVVETLGETVLIFTLPTKDPGRDCINGNTTSYTCVVVHHGYLPPVYIGTIQYPKASIGSTIGLAVGICVLVLLLLLIVIIIVVFRVHDKKLKRRLDALILERLILLQKSVEEQLDNLNADKNKPQESIFLPNNIQINAEDVKIRYNDLTMDKLLGHGAFGEVYLATLRIAGGMTCQVAVKTIQGEKDPSTVVSFLEEGLIMKDFDHPNVLGLFGLTFDPEGSPLVVLPLMENGDLKSFIKKTTMEIQTEQKLKFSIDAARGMEYLAGKKFVHRDLAARNCMVDDDMVVKIGDFGRSRDMGDEDDYVSNDKKAKLPVKWMAPESLDRKLYNEKTDVWSFGVLMWEIFTDGAKPYRQIPNRNVYYYVTTGNRLPCPENCREDVYDIMRQCWNIDPDKRCKFSELHQKLAMILSVHTQALLGDSSDQKLPKSADRTSVNVRNSYLELEGNPVDNRDSYLHPTEGVNEGFVMEMKQL